MSGLDILLALVFAVVVDVACDWLTLLSKWLACRAASILPRKYRARYRLEWTAELMYRPRLLRIFYALGLFFAAHGIRLEAISRRDSRRIRSRNRPLSQSEDLLELEKATLEALSGKVFKGRLDEHRWVEIQRWLDEGTHHSIRIDNLTSPELEKEVTTVGKNTDSGGPT